MPEAALLLLEQARKYRDQAERARRLVEKVLMPDDVVARLARYADEMDRRAAEFETRAAALRASIAKASKLTAEIGELVEKADERARAPRRRSGDDSD